MARGNFGERLKRERELREVPLKEVTVATRISLRYLEALENEEWGRLPGGAFNRGFVRAIARYLGLNEEDLLAEYDLAVGEHSGETRGTEANRVASGSKWLIAGVALALALIIAGLVAAGIWAWRHYTAARTPAQAMVLIPSGKDVGSGFAPGREFRSRPSGLGVTGIERPAYLPPTPG